MLGLGLVLLLGLGLGLETFGGLLLVLTVSARFLFLFACRDIAFLHNLLPVLLGRRLTPEKLSPLYFFTCIDSINNAEFKSKRFPRIAPTVFFTFVDRKL